jgi:hypothetical protein
VDNQPLNTGEQKDMTEFFTDLISKLEEMNTDLKETLRGLFAGQLSNNVVSLDCDHISRTNEEFYTLRCKVADMRNLYDSLDELTVKDTLEGDNMYTCSQCGKKVRAEKRACLKRLPKILCFNTLRYTFNMVTMTKEKVNTHFSFPMRIDMSPYLEQNLIRNEPLDSSKNASDKSDEPTKEAQTEPSNVKDGDKIMNDIDDVSTEYELIGVTVHTGTADGGHYYCFIREPDVKRGKDKWYIFNDAEVHLFDASQLASECFGGEVTSKTYDSVNDKFMDFPIEKTNSAYMLFYERLERTDESGSQAVKVGQDSKSAEETLQSNAEALQVQKRPRSICWLNEMPVTLRNWILNDNYQFNRDKSLFEHSYFHFMWQVCAYIPQTTTCSLPVHLHSTQLATAFVVETLIHSKEKPTIANWIELLTKQFNANPDACEWLIDHISEHYFQWPVQILFRCPNQMVRQLFQRLCIHVITQLRCSQRHLYLLASQTTTEQNVSERRQVLNAIRSFRDSSEPNLTMDDDSTAEKSTLLVNKQTVNQTKELSHLESDRSVGPSDFPICTNQQMEMIEQQMPDFGLNSCVSRFIRRFLLLIKCNHLIVKSHLKNLTEYFNLLYEFAKMGEIEVEFLLKIEAISIIVNFYMNACKSNGEFGDLLSEEEEDDCIETVEEEALRESTKDMVSGFNLNMLPSNSSFIGPRNAPLMSQFGPNFREFTSEKYVNKPIALEKMLGFVAYLVENSRCSNTMQLGLCTADHEALTGRNFAFLQRQIRENINLRQSFNLICTLSRHNDRLASSIVSMVLQSINKQPDISQPFFVILSMLVELCNGEQSSSSGMPSFSSTIYPKIWEIAEQNPLHCLEWLTSQVPRNQSIHQIVLQNLDNWSEYFLIGHANQRVRNAAAVLIISLVPNNLFRQSYYKSPKTLLIQTNRDTIELGAESLLIIRKIFESLLSLLKRAKAYVDIHLHGTNKLTSYFALMYYCLVSPKEKLMLIPYFDDLWNLFQPKLSEPAIPINQNKQTLLCFWYHACVDCPENVQCIIQNPSVTKNIAYNYILADHDDQDVIIFNRLMLPSYYGLLRLCCTQSRQFTRQLASHQNIIWAFKNITPYLTQYQSAVNELFKLMRLFIQTHTDSTEQDLQEIAQFKRNTILLYLNSVDPRSCWTTLIAAFTILFENEQDQVFAISNGAIPALFLSFNTLFMMFHEATACHITSEIVDVLRLLCSLLSTLHVNRHQTDLQEQLNKWKEHTELIRKPIHLLNTYTPSEVRAACLGK